MADQAQVQEPAAVVNQTPVSIPNAPSMSLDIMGKLGQRNDANIMQSHFSGSVPELQQAAAQTAQTLPQAPATITVPQALQNGLPLTAVGQQIQQPNGNQQQVPATNQQPATQVAAPVTEPTTTPNVPNIFTRNGTGAPEFRGWGEQDANVKIGEYVQQQFSINDPQTFINSANKWRADSRQLQEAVTLADNLSTGIETLPSDIKTAIKQYNSGEDYHTALQNAGGINFGMPFENHVKDKIVDHFNPNWKDLAVIEAKQVHGDDIAEDKLKIIISNKETNLYNNSKLAFNQQKDAFNVQRERVQNEAALRRDTLIQSAQSSVNALKDSWPGFDETESQKIHDILTKGDINSIFYDSKGNYKPDAAERLAWTIHGSSREETTANQAARDAESVANANNLRQAGKKNVNEGSQNPNAAQQQGAGVNKMFAPHFQKSPLAHVGRRSK